MNRRRAPRALLILALASSACGDKPAPPSHGPAAKGPQAEAVPPAPPPDAEKTASGLASKLLKAASGDKRPELHDKVRVHFSAWNTKGKQVDSSHERGGPVTFEMTGVIAGWKEALQLMRVGEKRRLWIPDELVYPGRSGYPRANSIFDLELLEVIDGVPPQPAPTDVAAAPAGAVTTGSGLRYKLLRPSTGAEKPNPWDRVTIHYTGWTTAGTMFESSHSRQQPSVFDVDGVMPGWQQVLPVLSAGDSARLWIPEALAYQGRTGKPQGTVVFDIELLSIERRPQPPQPPEDVAAAPAHAKTTRSGLAYHFVTRTKGSSQRRPKRGERVQVHYSAWTADGKLFDSSVARGKPATVPLDRLIAGWAEGLRLMSEGDKALLWIPEKLAYRGADGAPRGMLVYQVELLKIAP